MQIKGDYMEMLNYCLSARNMREISDNMESWSVGLLVGAGGGGGVDSSSVNSGYLTNVCTRPLLHTSPLLPSPPRVPPQID